MACMRYVLLVYVLFVCMTIWTTLLMLEIISRLFYSYLNMIDYLYVGLDVVVVVINVHMHTSTYFIFLSICIIHVPLVHIYPCIWFSDMDWGWHDGTFHMIIMIMARWHILCGLMTDFWDIDIDLAYRFGSIPSESRDTHIILDRVVRSDIGHQGGTNWSKV